MHAHPGPHQEAFQKHILHECGQRPASNETKEELRKVQGGSIETLALAIDINLEKEHTSAHTSGRPHGKGRVSSADAAWNLSFAVLGFEVPALRCRFVVGLLTFCFFLAGGASPDPAAFFPPDVSALRFLDNFAEVPF